MAFVLIASAVFATALLFGLDVVVAALLAMLFSVFYLPVECDISAANVNALMLALISIILFCEKYQWRVAQGFLLAITLLFKPVIVVPVFLIFVFHIFSRDFSGRMKCMVGFVSGTLTGFSIPVLFSGTSEIWTQWLFNIVTSYGSYYEGNLYHK